MAYHEIAKLSRDEIDFFPIINNPVDNWRKLLEGYLCGDALLFSGFRLDLS